MKYKFKCTECNKEEEKDILMAEYDNEKDKQRCSICSSLMKRVIEFSGSVKLCSGMYGLDSTNGWTT